MAANPRGDSDHWRLDYGWARRGGRWHEHTDVLLVGRAGGDACLAEALRQWLARQPSRQGLVDGAPRAVFHNGGVQGYLEGGDDTNLDSCTIHLHSHGEDAFDSLSDCSKQIARFARARGCEQRLQWVEARHDRSDHQLRWA